MGVLMCEPSWRPVDSSPSFDAPPPSYETSATQYDSTSIGM